MSQNMSTQQPTMPPTMAYGVDAPVEFYFDDQLVDLTSSLASDFIANSTNGAEMTVDMTIPAFAVNSCCGTLRVTFRWGATRSLPGGSSHLALTKF